MILVFVIKLFILCSSAVVSLACTFGSLLNKALKSATQPKLYIYYVAWYI